MTTDISKLKAENNNLKYKLYITLKEKDRWNSNCNTFYNACKKQLKTLQEIKTIVECVIDNDNSLKTDHCFGYCGECSSSKHCKLYPYWQITHLITKAESEV